MDVTMIGLQNAGKTSLLRVLAVRNYSLVHTEHVLTSQLLRAVNSPLSKFPSTDELFLFLLSLLFVL